MLSPQPLRLVSKFGPPGEASKSWKQSRPWKLRYDRTAHVPQWKTYSCDGLSVSCTFYDMWMQKWAAVRASCGGSSPESFCFSSIQTKNYPRTLLAQWSHLTTLPLVYYQKVSHLLVDLLRYLSHAFKALRCFPFAVMYILAPRPVPFNNALGAALDYNDIFAFNIVSQKTSRALSSSVRKPISSLSSYQCLRLCRIRARQKLQYVSDNPGLTTFKPRILSFFPGLWIVAMQPHTGRKHLQ